MSFLTLQRIGASVAATLRRYPLAAIAAVVVIALALFRDYLFGGSLQYGDANYLWDPGLLSRELDAMHHIWRDQSGGISGAIGDETQSFLLFQMLFAPFGIALSTVLPLVAAVAIAFLGFRRLAVALGGGGVVATIGATFYAGNPWFWDQILAGHLSICAAAALAPFTLHAVLDAYRGKRYAGWLLLGLCAIQLWIDPRTAMLVYPVVVAAGVGGAVDLRRQGSPWFAFALFAVLAPVFGVLANGWWTGIYAFVPNGALVPPFYPPIEAETTYGAEADLPHALALSGYFLQFSWHRMLQLGLPVFALWYGSMLALLTIPAIAARSRPLRAAAVAVLIVGFVASMGYHAIPLPVLDWAYGHVPAASLLREPVKFGFLVALAISILLVLWLQNASAKARWWAGIAVAIAVFPVVTGNLTSPDGHGLQVLSQRAQYADVLGYIRSRDPDRRYRTAVLPPWLAEQRLTPDSFYVANPFVIQNDVAVIDAKLINTASATDNAAWLAFDGLYRGTDTHPAKTLGAFGIRFVVVLDGVTLSPGAADTPFNVSSDRLHFILGGDPGFHAAYHVGNYWIYEDDDARPAIRAADGPLIAGPIPAAVRQALPAETLGDDIDRRDAGAPPAGTITTALDPVSACADLGDYAAATNAYAAVGRHQDYTAFWVASDWIIRGPDTIDGRLIARLAVPYAFTRSSSSIDVPISTRRGGTLYASLGTLGTRVDAHVSVDGRPSRAVRLDDGGLRWYALGEVPAGSHVVSIAGSAAGVAAGKIVVVAGGCPPPNGALDRYRIDGNIAQARVHLDADAVAISVDEAGTAREAARIAAPPGAAAIAIDGAPVLSDVPFAVFRGAHGLTFLAPNGPSHAGPWALSDAAPFNVNPGSLAGKGALTLVGGRWTQLARSAVKAIPDGQPVLVGLRCDGRIDGATVEIDGAGGAVESRMQLSDACGRTIAYPFLGSEMTLAVVTPARARGKLTIRSTAVSAGAQVGDPAWFSLPTRATHLGRSAASAPGAVLMRTVLAPDGSLVETANGTRTVTQALHGQTQALLQLRGLRASEPVTVTLYAYYQMGVGDQRERATASFDAGTRRSSIDLRVPIAPGSVGIAIALRTAGHAVLSLDSATLRELPSSAGDYVAGVPRGGATRGSDLAFARTSQEKYVGKVPAGGAIVGDFTYDPSWTATGSTGHWIVDGRANGWTGLPRGDAPVTVAFALAPAFAALQILGALLVLLVFGVAAYERRRARAT